MINSFRFIALVFTLTMTSHAWGWGEVGHETVGEIAERHLTPRAKQFVFSILGVEPLSASAIFPDLVRSDKRFNDFTNYHFVTLTPGTSYEDMVDKPKKDMFTILNKGAKRLVAKEATREEKTILLKYLIHIVGDAHQPLHVGIPGEMGGNLCDIQWKDESGRIHIDNLHHFWDDLIISFVEKEFHRQDPAGKPRWFGYKELSDVITLEHKEEKSNEFEVEIDFNPETFSNWFTEDLKLSNLLYPNVPGKNGIGKAYCRRQNPNGRIVNGSYDENQIPLLDDAYLKKALPILKSQLWKGGLRLAAYLNYLAVASDTHEMNPKKEKALLDALKIENDN